MNMSFDQILAEHSSNLSKYLRIDKKLHSKIATTINKELYDLSLNDINEIKKFSPVDLEYRIQELARYDELLHKVDRNLDKISGNELASFINYRSYIIFVYLQDNCFKITRKKIPAGTLTKKICKFLTDNPIRAFRNSIAHGNFFHSNKKIVYYAHKDSSNSDAKKPIKRYELDSPEWNFWQELARGTAYTIYGHINKRDKRNNIQTY